MNNKKLFFLGILSVGVIFVISLVFWIKYDISLIVRKRSEGRPCTLEAKVCPDGTTVGRTGPNCEFAPCPISREPAQEAIIFDTYETKFPASFFITSRDFRSFAITSKRWEGESAHFPGVYVKSYTAVIPKEMSLRDWLSSVGDPSSPLEPRPIDFCKDSIEGIRKGIQYPAEEIKGDGCWYFGVDNIKDVSVAGFEGLEFTSQAVSESARHTIFKYENASGSVILFDVIVTTTGLSEPDDGIPEAYQMVLNNFSLRDQ